MPRAPGDVVKVQIEHVPAPMTAREVLIRVLGSTHADHTIVRKKVSYTRNEIDFECSCGVLATVTASEHFKLSLRNVYEGK